MQHPIRKSFYSIILYRVKRSIVLGVMCLVPALPAAGQTVLNMAQDMVAEQEGQDGSGALNAPVGTQGAVLAPLNGPARAGMALNRPGAPAMSQIAQAPVIESFLPPGDLHPDPEGRGFRKHGFSPDGPRVAAFPLGIATHPVIARRDARLITSRPWLRQPVPGKQFPGTFMPGVIGADLPSVQGFHHLNGKMPMPRAGSKPGVKNGGMIPFR